MPITPSKCILLIAALLIPAMAQAQHPIVSHADSLKIKRYLDTVNSAPVYSQKRQHYIDSVLAIAPWRAHLWQQKAMPLYKQKKYEAGSPYLDSAVKYDVRSYIDYRAFMKCIFQKSYTSAIHDFWAAKTIIGDGDVMDHTYDFYIGLSYLQLDQFDSAEYYLVKTTRWQREKIGPHYVHPLDLFYLAIVYYEKENYPLAQQTLDSALALYPNFSDAKYYKAMCYYRSGNAVEAKNQLKAAAADFRQGYTMNEDNAIYEAYPYQVMAAYYKGVE